MLGVKSKSQTCEVTLDERLLACTCMFLFRSQIASRFPIEASLGRGREKSVASAPL